LVLLKFWWFNVRISRLKAFSFSIISASFYAFAIFFFDKINIIRTTGLNFLSSFTTGLLISIVFTSSISFSEIISVYIRKSLRLETENSEDLVDDGDLSD